MAYTPAVFPRGADIAEYLQQELLRISAEFTFLEDGRAFPILHNPPLKERDGMLVNADGTDWNPGSGAGYYERVGGVWVKL